MLWAYALIYSYALTSYKLLIIKLPVRLFSQVL